MEFDLLVESLVAFNAVLTLMASATLGNVQMFSRVVEGMRCFVPIHGTQDFFVDAA